MSQDLTLPQAFVPWAVSIVVLAAVGAAVDGRTGAIEGVSIGAYLGAGLSIALIEYVDGVGR